jgi:Protein of unknown function (DUF3565)
MQRAIVGYHQDERGDWIAELDCGHRQHVRHQPPFQLRPWVVDAEGRRRRLGTPLDCRLCDQDEPAPAASADAGGEAACFAPILCRECGVVLDGSAHVAGCTLAE